MDQNFWPNASVQQSQMVTSGFQAPKQLYSIALYKEHMFLFCPFWNLTATSHCCFHCKDKNSVNIMLNISFHS